LAKTSTSFETLSGVPGFAKMLALYDKKSFIIKIIITKLRRQ